MWKSNVILAIVALLLAIPTGLTVWSERAVFTDVAELQLLFPGFTRANVRGVGISSPVRDENGQIARDEKGEPKRSITQFVRTDRDWVIAEEPLKGAPVRDDRIFERVLQHVEAIRRDEEALVLSDGTPEQLARYGLSPEEAIEVRCVDAQGRMLAELMIGKDASAGRVGADVVRGFFVRARDSSDVVLYEQNYWVLDTDPQQWCDRNPLRFAVDDALRVHVKAPKGEVVFRRAGREAPDWTMERGPDDVGAVRNAEVRALLQTIASFNVQDYQQRLPQDGSADTLLAEHGLIAPKIFAEVELADGRKLRFDVGRQVPGKNEYWIRISSIEFLLTAGDWVVTRFDRDPEQYFDPAKR